MSIHRRMKQLFVLRVNSEKISMKYIRSLILLTSVLLTTTSLAAISVEPNEVPVIHETHFTNDKTMPVWVDFKLGKKEGGVCHYTQFSPSKAQATGVNINVYWEVFGDTIKKVYGSDLTCASLVFTTSSGTVEDNFDLIWDGYTYSDTSPHKSLITLK